MMTAMVLGIGTDYAIFILASYHGRPPQQTARPRRLTDACPVFPGKRYENWNLLDSAGQSADATRPIRDEVEQRVCGLLAELGVTAAK